MPHTHGLRRGPSYVARSELTYAANSGYRPTVVLFTHTQSAGRRDPYFVMSAARLSRLKRKRAVTGLRVLPSVPPSGNSRIFVVAPREKLLTPHYRHTPSADLTKRFLFLARKPGRDGEVRFISIGLNGLVSCHWFFVFFRVAKGLS